MNAEHKYTNTILWLSGPDHAIANRMLNAIHAALHEQGRKVKTIRSHELEGGINCGLGESAAENEERVRRLAHTAKILSEHHKVIIILSEYYGPRASMIARKILPGMLEILLGQLNSSSNEDGGLLTATIITIGVNLLPTEKSFQQHASSIVECIHQHQSVTSPQITRRPTIAVDFDGVIANYDGWQGQAVLGSPRADVVSALRQLNREGWKVIIYTTRGVDEIEVYLLEAGIPFEEINRNSDYSTQGHKPVATVYWDDRALTYSGDALRDLDSIRNFRTWSGRR